jgi:hypothetical protein
LLAILCYDTLKKSIAKVTKLNILRWEDFPGLSDMSNIIPRVLTRTGGRIRSENAM